MTAISMLKRAQDDFDFAEELGEKFVDALMSDDEPGRKKLLSLANLLLDLECGDDAINNIFIALCGWSLNTLAEDIEAA